MHVRDCFLLVFILFLPIYIIWRPADVRDVRIWLFVMFVSFEYLNTCYTCFLFLFSSLFNFVPLFTECHQVYEMYVAGFKFHLLNNAFTSHWGFQVQQDEVLLKTTKVNRLRIRKKKQFLISGVSNKHFLDNRSLLFSHLEINVLYACLGPRLEWSWNKGGLINDFSYRQIHVVIP